MGWGWVAKLSSELTYVFLNYIPDKYIYSIIYVRILDTHSTFVIYI